MSGVSDHGIHNNVGHEVGHTHGRQHPWEDSSYLPSGAASQNCGRRSEYGYGVYPGQHPFYAWTKENPSAPPADAPYPPMANVQGWLIPPTSSLGDNNAQLGDISQCDGRWASYPVNLNDMMGYAYPYWINGYTYAALATRIQGLAAAEGAAGPKQRTLQGVFLRDGSVRWRVRYQQISTTLPVDGRNRVRLDLPGGSRDLPVVHKLSGEGAVAGVIIPLPEEARAETLAGIHGIVGGKAFEARPAELRKALRAQ